MPKEIKDTSRRSRRQCMKVDNIKKKPATKSKREESRKSATRSKRYSPFQRGSYKREHVEPGPREQNATMTSTELLHSISGSIIGNGIKYIMFPLHLLRFCIFGASSGSVNLAVREDDRGSRDSGSNCERRKKEDRENESSRGSRRDASAKEEEASSKRSSEESQSRTRSRASSETRHAVKESREKSSKEERKKDDKGPVEKPPVIVEDSDSSGDRWSTASSSITEHVSMDIDRFVSFDRPEEPMDISMEEYAYERSQILAKPYDKKQQDSCSSVDEEIARIFQKQCTSSDDEYSSSHSCPLPEKRDKTRGQNYLCHERSSSHSAATVSSRSKKEEADKERKKKTSSEDVNKERKKKTPSEDVAHYKRRKMSHEEDRPEKQKDSSKSSGKRREEKHSSKQESPSKSKTRSPRSSRTPVKSGESKRRDVKYRETATQTDSAFSDEDVEMIPVDANMPEKRFCCVHASYRSHPNLYLNRRAEHDSNYVADNEDSSDGFTRIARKRISSCSTSSSSTDLGFDEHGSGTSPDFDVGTGRCRANVHDTITDYRVCSRAPPGFPQVPQNPPLFSYVHSDWYKVTTRSLKNNSCDSSSVPLTMVPRAPSPMRHLYYEYPEFMDLPATVNSSRILDILS